MASIIGLYQELKLIWDLRSLKRSDWYAERIWFGMASLFSNDGIENGFEKERNGYFAKCWRLKTFKRQSQTQ